MDAVAKLGDPRGIPFLVATLEYGSISANALADFGAVAFPAVLEAVSDPDAYPYRVSRGLDALRFMLEDGTLTAGQANQVRAVVRDRLSGAQHHKVVFVALKLALALKDPELRGIVERFADDRGFAETLISPYLASGAARGSRDQAQWVNIRQEYARTLLDGGGANIGLRRRRMAIVIH